MGAYADLLPDSSDSANTSSSVARSSGNQRVDAFVEQYRPIAERVAEQTGNDPELYLAKWGLETGWGKSIIPGTNNLGNIKDFSGSGVSAKDNATGSVDRYRQYKDANQFADDYASLLNRRYKNALNVGSDIDTFSTELKRAGYAEDPNYVSKLKSAYNMLGGSAAQSDASHPSQNAHGEYEPRTDYSAALRQFDKVPNDTYEANRLASTPKGMSISKEISAAIDSYQANLWSIPAAMGSEYALNAMLENKSAAEQQWADSGAPQSFSEMEFGKNFGQYFAHMAIQSAPYMLEFIASGFGVGSLAKGALANTAKGVAEKAAIEAAKQGATKEAAKKAGEVAAKEFMGTVYTASGVAGSYPSAVGDVLSNQYEESGKFNLPAAAALGVPYAALNAAGAEGMLTRGLARGLPKTSLTAKGAAGFAGRAALTGAEAGVMDGSTETGQEVMNQLGRMAVNPDAKIDDRRALEAYKESFIAGVLLSGVPGAVAGGFRKPEDAKLQPPAPVANSPLSSAVNTAQHVEKQQQQAAVDDHREQILGMIAQRDDLTERIAGLQNMIDRADPSSEDGQRIRAMQSDMQMRRDSLVAQLDAAKAFYGGDQTANVGPTNDPLILGNEQMSRIYQVTQNLLNDPASLDPESRSGLLKGFSVMRNRTLPEATRIDAAMSLIATMDDMAARRAAAASGRADEREWNAFASDEAARDGEAKLRAIDKSLANSGPKPLPENEVTTMRAQLLDRVLATNPENPNRTFDRALRLEGFRDSAFTDAEKARIAQFAAMRAAPASTNGSTLLPSPSQGRYQHLSEMLDSGWVAADRGRLVGPNGEVYNLKGAGEAQFVRNKLNQKDGNGSQSPRGGAQGGTDQGDFGVGGAGANGPLPQGGGNGSGQANALPDTRPADGAVSEAEATGAGSQPNDPLNQNPTGRLTPLDDQRIAKYAGDLRSMAPDAGYAERGGRNLRDHNDNFTSRTVGIPTAEWFLPGMLNSPQASVDAVERAIRGYPMKKKEKLHVQGMMDFLDMQYGIDGESHTEQLATLSDIAYEGESADAQNIIDTLGDVDLESNGAWADEVESMRALGFTEEEINEITRRKQGAFGSVGEEAAGVPAGEAQTAIPEGDGNGNGQAEGQEGFSLNQQTNTEAAAQFAQQQAGESTEITKEQADKERDAVPFSMQMQSQPKPQGTQVGLFTADGRPSVAAKQPETAKRKIFRDNKETGVREVHEVDAQDVAISELPDHQFFVFKDEEKGAYSLTEASTGLRVGVGETAEAAISNFKAALEKVGVETFAQRVADSPKIQSEERTKPVEPNLRTRADEDGFAETEQEAGGDAEKLGDTKSYSEVEKKLINGEINVEDFMSATGLTDDDVGFLTGNDLRQQADVAAKENSPYFSGIRKLSAAIFKEIEGLSRGSTAQSRRAYDANLAKYKAAQDTLEVIAKNFEHPFRNTLLSKLPPFLESRYSKQWDSVEYGDKAKKSYRSDSYSRWVDLLIDAARKKSDAKQINNPDDSKPDQAQDFSKYILISADDISKLRKIDVERVLEQGAVKQFRQEFADWIKAKRPDLAQEVDAVMAELSKRKVDTKPAQTEKPLTVGKAPNGAEPVSVRDGVLYIGEDPVLDYETEQEVRVGDNASNQEIADALRASGQLGSRKIFGLPPKKDLEAIKRKYKGKSESQQKTNAVAEPMQEQASAVAPENEQPAAVDSDFNRGKAMMAEGIDKLISLLGGKTNMLPEEEAQIIPVMSQIFRGAALMGYAKFKEASRFVLDTLRNKSPEVADKIELKNLQAAYININGFGSDPDMASVQTVKELYEEREKFQGRIAAAEQRTALNPTEAQKESGVYPKGKFAWRGMTISIETVKGEERSGVDESGQPWSITAPTSYGYFLGTTAADKEHLDVYIGNKPESDRVYVINQTKVDSPNLDEHKILIGFDSEEDAKQAYFSAFSEGFAPRVFGSLAGPFSVDEFKDMLPKLEKAKFIEDRVTDKSDRLNRLPDGRDGTVGGIATNKDPVRGGIVDKAIASDEWFYVPHDDALETVDGFKSQQEAIEALQKAVDQRAKYLKAAEKFKEKQAERAIVPLDQITVTRSAQLDGKAVEYDQQANEALQEIDGNMDLAKRLLECLAS